MSARDLKTLVVHFATEWNKGKKAAMAVIEETWATNCVFHQGNGEDVHGVKDYKKNY